MNQEPNYNYLDRLNPQQREAILNSRGPSLVIAGAGSGKTRVLTYKIVDLIAHGMEPYRILALTFTNKAAREMKDRISKIVGEKVAARLRMGTFHSVFLSILRQHTDKIGFKPGFTIYDSADSKSLVKMIVKDFGLDDKVYKSSTILSAISRAKNAMISPEQYLNDFDQMEADRKLKRPMTGRIFEAYCLRCRISNAMDFDDILFYMNLLLRDNPEIRRHYQDFFRFILVDEYQDTNFAQDLIIRQLAGTNQRIFLVGDDAQSIYSFRGANINNILGLEKNFPGIKIFKLERNYRSTQNIVDAAGSLIKKNRSQFPKNVYSKNERGDLIRVISSFSDFEEAALVANLVSQTKLTQHDSYDEIAVLYRTNAQSRALEESLRRRNIPYRIYGGLSFYQRKEVKDAVAYFKLSVNPDDDEALKRVINFPPRGIGETTMKKLSEAAKTHQKSIWGVINDCDLKSIGLNSGTAAKIINFKNLILTFIEDNEKGSNAYELGQLIYNRTGLLSLYAYDHTPESISRHENLTEILSGLKDFVTLSASNDEKDDMQTFLSQVMLATDQDEKETDDQPKVNLMTVHAAKGLEFKHVFIVGVEDDLFPSALSKNSISEFEEERRLLYVAITRAMKTCVITYANQRFRNGQTVFPHPSPFLTDIAPELLDWRESSNFEKDDFSSVRDEIRKTGIFSHFQKKGPLTSRNTHTTPQPKTFTSSPGKNFKKVSELSGSFQPQHVPEELKIGNIISHSKFGTGEITEINTLSGEASITVEFKDFGVKRLLLRFAKFDVIK